MKRPAKKRSPTREVPAHLPRKLLVSVPDGAQVEVRTVTEVRPLPGVPRKRDEAYLAYVRRQPCCAPGCLKAPAGEAHHDPARGMGGCNGDDRRSAPLCRAHHQQVEDTGRLPLLDHDQTHAWLRQKQLSLLIDYLDRVSGG